MILYRLMKTDADDKPRIGTSFGCLGVRPPGRGPGMIADIDVDHVGNVHPGTDGLSTFDRAMKADRKHAVWSIDVADLVRGGDLLVLPSPDTPGRFHVTPRRAMTLAEYQTALASTRNDWTKRAEKDDT